MASAGSVPELPPLWVVGIEASSCGHCDKTQILYAKSATVLLVRILGSHPSDTGSSPGGGILSRISELSCQDQLLQHQEMHQPGIELILQFLEMILFDASN